ncbi:hypothetical protein [Methanobrevibacter sp.]
MNAEMARKLTEQSLLKNDEFKDHVKWTNENIKNAITKGERRCVLSQTGRLLPSLIKHFEDLGYTVKTGVPPYVATYYLYW